MVVPVEYAPPTEPSRILVLYDHDALYFAARFNDSVPGGVTAMVMRQGDLSYGEDSFTIFVGPQNDGRNGYLFDLNPNGIRSQALFTNVTEQNWNWQAIWQGAARQDERGWTAEVAIPFKSLSFDPRNHTWALNFTRWLGRRNERFGWVSHNREQNPANAGQITGLIGLDQGIGLDLVPSFRVGRVNDERSGDERNFFEPALDAFYKVTPALTAALTVNTDFSGTAADARQINLTRFALFYPEQRQFFLQDADIFEFGRIGNDNGKPFFSRQIGLTAQGDAVGIDYGGKLTGRLGPVDIGVLGVRQDASVGAGNTTLMVARLAANVMAESSVGMIATSGDPAGQADNELYGLDFRYLNTRISADHTIVGSLWYQDTDTEGLAGDGAAFGASLAVSGRRGWQGSAAWKELQTNYHPALGFANRTGIRRFDGELFYEWRPEGRWLRSIKTGAAFWRVDAVGGALESQEVRLNGLELQDQTADYLTLDWRGSREVLTEPFEISAGVVIPVGDYAFQSACLTASTGQHRRLAGEFVLCDGSFYEGERQSVAGSLTWRPNRHFRFDFGLDWNSVDLPQGSFITRLLSLQANIAFTNTWYWENFVQYDNVSETIGINSILRWVPQAGRETLLVLNRQLADLDHDRRFVTIYGDLTFKLGYTFRF